MAAMSWMKLSTCAKLLRTSTWNVQIVAEYAKPAGGINFRDHCSQKFKYLLQLFNWNCFF